MTDMIRALYSPSRKEVACVLLQAAMGGDRRACNLVHDWCVDMVDDFIMLTAPVEQWRMIGDMPKESRPGPEKFDKNFL